MEQILNLKKYFNKYESYVDFFIEVNFIGCLPYDIADLLKKKIKEKFNINLSISDNISINNNKSSISFEYAYFLKETRTYMNGEKKAFWYCVDENCKQMENPIDYVKNIKKIYPQENNYNLNYINPISKGLGQDRNSKFLKDTDESRDFIKYVNVVMEKITEKFMEFFFKDGLERNKLDTKNQFKLPK